MGRTGPQTALGNEERFVVASFGKKFEALGHKLVVRLSSLRKQVNRQSVSARSAVLTIERI